MGDINLLGMIRKIKNSLSGYVSTSDKASKSKFGIVKVGDNLSVSSGTISVPVATEETYGVVKAGGSSSGIDEIYTGDGSGTLNFTFPSGKDINSYKYLVLCCKTTGSTTASGIVAASLIASEGFTWCACWYNSSNFANYKLTPTGMVADSNSGGMVIRKVYGVS